MATIVQGAHNKAIVYAETYTDEDIAQVKAMCDLPFLGNANIRMMPDMHKGAGCTIGTTMRVDGNVVPNFIGVDLSCGVLVAKLPVMELDFAEFDNTIRENVPMGRNVRGEHDPLTNRDLAENYYSLLENRWGDIDREYTARSVGTLGGGNHFIEVGRSEETGSLYLSIHSGSRKFGHSIATNYQNLAYESLRNKGFADVIAKMRAEGRHKEIQGELERLKKTLPATIDKDTAFLSGKNASDYMRDMGVASSYAKYNRISILIAIFRAMGWTPMFDFDTAHNYIDFSPPDDGLPILRKGAVSARKGEKFIVPLNMRDGSLICMGKGNPEWNFSAPHGAGRIMSRRKAREEIGLNSYRETMEKAGVFSTSVSEETLDEAPFAYKDAESIANAIQPTAEIIDRLIPVYNIKAGGED